MLKRRRERRAERVSGGSPWRLLHLTQALCRVSALFWPSTNLSSLSVVLLYEGETVQEATDADLVQRSAQGDRAAFVELIRRYRGSLVSLIRRLVSDLDEAEDLLQETLVQSWLNIASVRSPERVQAWLLQVARNLCRDYHKSAERREHPTEQRELESYVNRYGRAASPEPMATGVGEALHRLSPAEREAVQLFYAQGLTMKEVSARTRSPIGTVKSRLFTARHHLRSFFGITEEEERKK